MGMSNQNLRVARLRRQAVAWLAGTAVLFGIYRVYRWAEPSSSSIAAVLSPSAVSNVSLELEEATFENYAEGKKNWSLWARRIAIERQNGGVPNSLQAATIDDIRDGKLFSSPLGKTKDEGGRMKDEVNSHSSLRVQPSVLSQPTTNHQPPATSQSGSDSDPGLPAATFSAQHGRYLVGSAEGLPTEMQFTYSVQWQFQLTGDVKIRTREGHQFHAPAILILELYNRKTGKAERHMLCNQGGEIKAKGATVQANQARYDEKNQTVECLGGVHAQLQQDSVQGEHFYWALKDNALRSPDQVSGVWQGCAYTASDILIDATQQVYQGKRFRMQLNGKNASKLVAGSLGLVMTTGLVSNGQTPPGAKTPSANATATAQGGNDLSEFEGEDFKSVNKSQTTTAHHFTYTRGSRVITGDNGRYDKKNGVLDADGHMVMDDPEHHGICQKAHVEETKALAVLTGDVVLTLKPQTPAAGDNPNDISAGKNQGAVVTCDQVDSYYKKKFTVLRGHLVFKQHILRAGQEPLDRTGTAEHAEYDDKNEVLTLFPPVLGHDSDETQFYSNDKKVIITTKSGEESITGAHGKVISHVKETPEDDNPANAGQDKKTGVDKKPTPGAIPGGATPSGGAIPDAPANPAEKPQTTPSDAPKKAEDKPAPDKKDTGKPTASK